MRKTKQGIRLKQNQGECEGRNKWWCELTDSEKLERMREVIKNLQFTTERIYQLESMIKRHVHHKDDVCLPVINNYGEPVGMLQNKNDVADGKVYF